MSFQEDEMLEKFGHVITERDQWKDKCRECGYEYGDHCTTAREIICPYQKEERKKS